MKTYGVTFIAFCVLYVAYGAVSPHRHTATQQSAPLACQNPVSAAYDANCSTAKATTVPVSRQASLSLAP